jgi:hypothetical protein
MEKKAGNTEPKLFFSVIFLKFYEVFILLFYLNLPNVKFKIWLIGIPPRNVVAFHASRFRVNLIPISLFSRENHIRSLLLLGVYAMGSCDHTDTTFFC